MVISTFFDIVRNKSVPMLDFYVKFFDNMQSKA